MSDLRKPELSPGSTRVPSREFRHRLGKFIYVPTFITLLLVMIGTVFSGTTLIFFYDVENANLPKWFDLVITNFIVPIGSFYNVYDAESSKHLNIVFLTLIGIVMAIFVKRCSGHNNGFELFVVGSLIVLSLLMLYVKSRLPAQHLSELIKHPEQIYRHMEILVIRNCNLAAAIVAAALGSGVDC